MVEGKQSPEHQRGVAGAANGLPIQRSPGLSQGRIPDIHAWLSDRLGAAIVRLVEEVPPAPAEEVLALEEPLEEVLSEYTRGPVPEELSLAVRDAYRAAHITQAQAAKLLGLSRPHLANALAGRRRRARIQHRARHVDRGRPAHGQ